MLETISDAINNLFGPILQPVFAPTNALFAAIPEGAAVYVSKAAAVALFVGAIIMVFCLRREYVNLDAPGKKPWHDLRIWTIVSMLPHIIVYLTF